MELYEEWQEKIKDISTNTFSISIGELINRYKENRIKINPIYQRHYRWTNEQKSQFIESLLLGYPIPPLFMYRDIENSNWEVIDGLQRLATIFEFVGVLEAKFPKKETLNKLEKTSKLLALENKDWNLFKKEKLDFVLESQTLQVVVLDNKSSKDTKYEIFRRLNSSASILSNQEIRNASMYEISPDFFMKMENQFKLLDFSFLSDKDKIERKDMELFLEFIYIKEVIGKDLESENNNFSEVLNQFSMNVTSEKLENGFELFNRFLQCFSKTQFKYHQDNKPTGSFINAYFEIYATIFLLTKDKVAHEKIITIVSQLKYSEWQEKLKIKNPSAINRMKYAISYAKARLDEIK